MSGVWTCLWASSGTQLTESPFACLLHLHGRYQMVIHIYRSRVPVYGARHTQVMGWHVGRSKICPRSQQVERETAHKLRLWSSGADCHPEGLPERACGAVPGSLHASRLHHAHHRAHVCQCSGPHTQRPAPLERKVSSLSPSELRLTCSRRLLLSIIHPLPQHLVRLVAWTLTLE